MSKTRKQPTQPSPAASAHTPALEQAMLSSRITWVLLAAIMAVVAALRTQLLSIALERDEGGFAYIAQQLNHGSALLYTDLVDNKLPGLYAMYSVFLRFFGESATGIHAGLLVCSLVSMFLLFQICRRMLRTDAALAATLAFGLYAMSGNVFGFAAHATQVLLPFMLGGILLIFNGLERNRFIYYLLAGLCFGIAFTIKQQVVPVGIFVAIFALANAQTNRWKAFGAYSLGAIVPFLIICLYMSATGRFDAMWQHTVTLPALQAKLAGEARFSGLLFKEVISGGWWLVWLMAVAGAVLSIFSTESKRNRWFLIGFLASALAAVFIGLGGYQHYYVIALPALACAFGYAVHVICTRFAPANTWLALAVGAATTLIPVALQSSYYFTPDHTAIHRKAYGMNPFPEMQQLAEKIRPLLPKGTSVGILGSEPELNFYLNAPPASRHLYMFPLLHDTDWSRQMQIEYLADLEKSKPAYLLWVTQTGSWAPEYYKSAFFRSTKPMVEQSYSAYGKCELFENGQPSVVVLGDEAARYKFKGTYQVHVFKRK